MLSDKVNQYHTYLDFESDVDKVVESLRSMLLQKNRTYGDSALNPVRIFSKAAPHEQLLVRIDDKLSRIARGSSFGEDVINDLIGYLIMYKIQCMRELRIAKDST